MTHSVQLMFISNETKTDVFPTQHSSHKKCKNYCSFIIKKLKPEKKYLIEINMFHRFILRMKHLFFKPITHDYIFHQILSICKHDKLMSTIFCCVLRFLSLMIQNRSSHRNMNISTWYVCSLVCICISVA